MNPVGDIVDVCKEVSSFLDLYVDGIACRHVNRLWRKIWETRRDKYAQRPDHRREQTSDVSINSLFIIWWWIVLCSVTDT